MLTDRAADRTWQANARALVAGRLVVAALGWAGTVVIARSLDADAFGRFTFVFGLLGMMTIITDLGLGRVALGGVLPEASDPARVAGVYIVLRALLGVIGYGVAVGFAAVAAYPAEVVRATAIAGVVVIIATVSHAYEIVLQAQLRMGVVAVAAIAGRVGQLGVTAAAAVAGGGLIWFVVPAIVAEVVIAAVKIPAARRLLRPAYGIRIDMWWVMVVDAIPLSIGAALAALYFRVDAIMLSKLDDFVAVGVYGVAFKFVDVLHFVALSVSAPVLTVLVRGWPNDLDRIRSTVTTVGVGLAAVGGLLAVYFGLFADETIQLLYGARYAAGADAARLLVAGQILAFCSALGLTVLTATAHHGRYPLVALVGLVVNVGLNLWAIPRWSYEGAALATIGTEVLVVAGMWWLVARIRTDDGRSLGSGTATVARLAAATVSAVAIGLGAAALVDRVAAWPLAALAGVAAYTSTGVVVLTRIRR